MARDTIWKGYISFGLVEIPVELVTAEVSHELALKLFDRRDHTPVGNKRISKVTGDEVPWSEVVKGYEYSDGEYVLLADQELKEANPEATQTIDIVDFVEASEVHPAYFEKPYYLRPSRKRGHKAYRLLHETLQRTERLGIARVVIRTRQRLAALTTRDGALMLSLLRYAHELRSPQDAGVPAADEGDEVTKQELSMAERLVEDMSGPWQPDKYKDDYRDDLLALIERKARAGQLEPVETPERAGREPEHADVLDLMPLLKRSVERAGERPARRREREPASRSKRPPPRRRSA